MSRKRFTITRRLKFMVTLGLIAAQLLSYYPAGQASAASEFAAAVQASQPSAKPGDTVTLTASISPSITRSINVQLQVVGANGAKVFDKWLTRLPVTAGVTEQYPVDWTLPDGLPAGKYSVSLGIFGADWDRMYSWDTGLAYVTVQSGASLPAFRATIDAPSQAAAGSTASVKAKLVSDQSAAASVRLAIYSPSNAKVHEETFADQVFAAQTALSLSTHWPIPADASGTYRVELAATSPDGAQTYYSQPNAGSIAVAKDDPAASAAFVTGAAAENPNVKAGDTAAFTAKIASDRNASVLVDVVVRNPYTRETVFQAVFERQALTAGTALDIPVSWNVPADAATGTYPIEIGIFGNGWEGPYHWNANAGYIQVTDGTAPQIQFTASTSVAQTPIRAGTTQSLSVTASSHSATEALVSVKVLNPQGTAVYTREFPNESFGARQPKNLTVSWPIPTGAELGTYTIETAITNADRTLIYYRNASAAQFIVEAGSTEPDQPDHGATANWTTSAEVAASAEAGYPVTVTAQVVSDDYAKALVDVEIWDESGQVYQSFVDNQYFQPNVPKQIPVTWNIPAMQHRGRYTVKIGVFPPGWNTAWEHHWNNGAASFEVNWGLVPDITLTSTVDAETVQPGTEQTIHTRLTSSETLPAAVRLELLDPAGNRVASGEYPDASFTQGVPNDYALEWTPGSDAVNGVYKLRVSVAKPDGVRVFYSNPDAARFSLTGGIDLAYTLSAETAQAEVSADQTLNVEARVGSTAPAVVSVKVNFVDALTGETVHSETLRNQAVSASQEATLNVKWKLPKWIKMDENKVRSGEEPLVRYVLDGDYKIGIELYNADLSYKIMAQDDAAAFKVVSPVDAPAPQPAEPPTLPNILKLGVFATNNDEYGVTGWMPETGLPWNFAYRYLNGGVNNEEGWTSWDPYNVGDWRGAYAYDYAKDATDRGYTPVFTFYEMLQTISGDCLNCGDNEAKDDLVTLNDEYAMRAYFEEFKLLMQLIGTGTYNGRQGIGKTAIVHVDPDLAGYAQQAVLDNGRCYGQCTGQGNNPAFLKAAVSSTRMPELADLPDTFQGYNWALLRLRDLYAPNVILAPHVNSWGTLIDVGRDTNPNLDVTALGKLAGEFANLSGVQTVPAGIKPYDFIFNDIDDDDAGGDRGYWLDRTNLTLPNFHRWEQFVKAASETTRKKVMIWQIPVGNQVYRAMDNTPGHYQDNKVEYFFGHLQELIDIGIVGLMFGHGQPGSTSHYNRMDDNGLDAPPSEDYYNPEPLTFSDGWGDGSVHTNGKEADFTDDDGGYLRLQATEYYKHPLPVSNQY
ncbi:hypothetical protein GE107_23545 [Cohnella sp. CFH 77786]|uniref:hypothetical protein n=1 Tax=Cohnella sp. CFH 77786 TaxID=2662265 RepID=UPI001C60925C|nr:hypothetical protein [Cohnella sp. CFH 77786]MBW5449009.1 hypothetical protein [Cohnella sp. CFH 77786]